MNGFSAGYSNDMAVSGTKWTATKWSATLFRRWIKCQRNTANYDFYAFQEWEE